MVVHLLQPGDGRLGNGVVETGEGADGGKAAIFPNLEKIMFGIIGGFSMEFKKKLKHHVKRLD